MLKGIFSHSIKRKLIIAIAALHAVLMTIFVADLVNRQQAFLIEESLSSTVGIAKTLAANTTPWVLSNDVAGLNEIIKSQSQQPNFIYAMITDTRGMILSFHHKDPSVASLEGEHIPRHYLSKTPTEDGVIIFGDKNTYIDLAAPIMVNDTLIGWARINMSRQNIFDSIRLITAEGMVYTLIAILIGTFFAWRLGGGLTKGIYQLVNATKRVTAGERDIEITLNRQDELQTLSSNFQSMLNTLNTKEQELFSEKERLEITLKSIGDGVITTDRDGLITYLNPVAELLTGWSHNSAKELHIEEVFKIYHEKTMEPVKNPALQSMIKDQVVYLENQTILINKAGEKISVEDSGAPLVDYSGEIIGSVLVFHDATEAHQLRKQLTWQALHDSLTGLQNRQAFENYLDELIAKSNKNHQLQHCLIYIDLDQFKVVNDTVGHSAGDELLKQVSSIILEQIRESDMLARIGGDEFAILLESCTIHNAQKIAEKVRLAVSRHRFTWEGRVFDIGTSLGITSIKSFMNKASVMSQADIACYIAKQNGRNRLHIFEEDDQLLTQELSKLDWVNRIKRAIEDGDFVLYAQKIEPLQDNNHKKVYEILVRLHTQEDEIIGPDQFLPAAERFNLMGALDLYIVKRAYHWLAEHFDEIDLLNINISGQSLNDEHFNQALLDILNKDSNINKKICFEITESTAITHMSASILFLNGIKNHGCQLALDDFGSGFSSFSWLKTLPVDYVKIDGTFILDALSDKVDAAMVRAIHEISEQMDIETVAEFVENQEVADWLKSVGIDYAQGYHYHKPTLLQKIL
ncbi:MAG: EAL domain-containing protein [Thiomicrorhabdus sp.]|nr:EAL domain-containing protein [Thiomicrorhabdus sp.]